ncbi:hypothetical protein SprV_0200778500 [Sparganum proliferum]
MESDKRQKDDRTDANEAEGYSSDISDSVEIRSLDNYLDSDHTEFLDSFSPEPPCNSQVGIESSSTTKTQIKTSATDAFLSKTPARKEREDTSNSKTESSGNGRRRRKRLFRRRTVEEFLSCPEEMINGKTEAGWIEADEPQVQAGAAEHCMVAATSEAPMVPRTSFSIETSNSSLAKELEDIHRGEKCRTEQLTELIKASPAIMSSLGKNASAEFLERTNGVHMTQLQVLLALEEACSQRNPKISKTIDKLCERQSQLIIYANLTPTILQTLKSKKEQSKSNITLQSQIDLVQVPTSWIAQTFETIKRLKRAIPDNCPEIERLTAAEEDLFGISENLNEFSSKLVVRKEPIKTSLVVEIKPNTTSERKLRTLFLFDDLLVSAHQRVIVFRKHFTEGEGDKPSDGSELLFDSETMYNFSERSDPVSLQMRTRSISRYEVKWFLPLEQLDSLRTDGLALDDEALRERLSCIENLKSKIKDVRAELEDERQNSDKESKRQKLKAPKIHRLRSTLYALQAELVLQAPRLPLFLTSTDGRSFCLLMTSERERMDWKKAITQAKHSMVSNKTVEKQPVTKKLSSLKSLAGQLPSFRQSPRPKDSVTRLTNGEVTSLVNHCKSVVPLNRLGKIIISGSALSGILQVTIHEVTGLDEIASYFVAVEVDCFGILEPVAKTRAISGTCSPCWNQTFVIELESSQSAFFALYRQSTVIAQLELPLDIDQLAQYSETWHTVRSFDSPPRTIKMKLSLSFTERNRAFVPSTSLENSDIFGQPLAEVLKRDQLRSERLHKIASSGRAEKITGRAEVLAPSGVHVPVIVSTCAEEIERRGLAEEGIYRICGSLSSVNYLKEQFNRDVDTAVKQLADYDVHVLSSLLKAFFRELPEPLITSTEFIAFVNALDVVDVNEKIKMLNHALASLPKPRRDTFQYLLRHLVRVGEHESSNKMGLSNLALIWAMTLFQPPTGVTEAESSFMTPNVTSIASLGAIQTRLLHQLLKSTEESSLCVDSTEF